jgi:ornithine cyclodeaminase/alanine dehydrogenase-like protein (mu-crystallin family)
VTGGTGLDRLRQMLADHDVVFIGNGHQAPLVVTTVDAWKRLAQIRVFTRHLTQQVSGLGTALRHHAVNMMSTLRAGLHADAVVR